MAYLSINNGFPGDNALKFYVSPRELGDELENDLRAAGIEAEPLLEMSETAQAVAVFAVGFLGGGGLKQLAAVLEAFFHRNDGKEITLRNGDVEISTKGIPLRQVEKVLEDSVEKQRVSDAQWKQFAQPDAGA